MLSDAVMSGLSTSILPMRGPGVPMPVPLPDRGQRWPTAGGGARLPRGLAVALAAHVVLLALLLYAGPVALPPPLPPPGGIELLTPAAALPPAQAATAPSAEPAAVPPPELARTPAAETMRPRDAEPVPVRDESPPARPVAHPVSRPIVREARPPQPASPAAATTAPATTAPAASASAPAAGWNERLLGWLERHRSYPEQARRRGEQGEVMVRISVAADGQVLDQRIAQSSGAPALDRAALEMLRGASLPPPGTALDRVVRLRYRLAD